MAKKLEKSTSQSSVSGMSSGRAVLVSQAVAEPPDAGGELARGAEDRGGSRAARVPRSRSVRGTAASARCRARRGG